MHIQERYHAMALGVNSTTLLPNNTFAVSFFAAVTGGTITITAPNGVVKLNGFPVSAGVYYPMPMIVGSATVVLAGGASGTMGYDS